MKTVIPIVMLVCFAPSARPDGIAKTNSDPQRFAVIESLVSKAIEEGQTPGAVVVLADEHQILYANAIGHRQVLPEPEAMTLDTVFDLASITKPVATATSVMMLVDRGKLDINASVANYLPEFAPHGKDAIVISDLLTHTGGLIPDNALRDYQQGPAEAWQRICQLKPIAKPREKFAYTDVGFIVLGKLVQRVSRQPLDRFAQQEIFQPLAMQETMFNPTATMRARAAATEQRDGRWMKGEVHDPRAFLLGGVAGHAGLFSTASDLVKYGQAMLKISRGESAHPLSHDTFQLMIAPRDVFRGTRTYGWDHQSPYSSNRGKRFSDQAFGHGGFTGTVLWIDPAKRLVYVFLASRLHPDGKGAVNGLAGEIATALSAQPPAAP